MKKLFLLSAAVILAVACTPKASKSVASSNTGATAPAGPSGGSAPTEKELTAAKTKFADVSLDQLQKGHSIYFGACTKCHAPENPNKGSEGKWSHVLDEMAPKANLNADEKEAVWRYIMSVRLASAK
jgi:mono/diheme cytochrome c family protein